jgi:hypothetical protein
MHAGCGVDEATLVRLWCASAALQCFFDADMIVVVTQHMLLLLPHFDRRHTLAVHA